MPAFYPQQTSAGTCGDCATFIRELVEAIQVYPEASGPARHLVWRGRQAGKEGNTRGGCKADGRVERPAPTSIFVMTNPNPHTICHSEGIRQPADDRRISILYDKYWDCPPDQCRAGFAPLAMTDVSETEDKTMLHWRSQSSVSHEEFCWSTRHNIPIKIWIAWHRSDNYLILI